MVKRIAAAAAAAVVLASPAGVAAERSDRMVMAGPSTKPVGTPVTAQQRRMLAEKLALVDRAMQSAANGRELAADHRMWLLETMYRMPVAELRAIAPDIGHDSLVKVVTKAAKSPAPSVSESRIVPRSNSKTTIKPFHKNHSPTQRLLITQPASRGHQYSVVRPGLSGEGEAPSSPQRQK